jgi:hypothetical protein
MTRPWLRLAAFRSPGPLGCEAAWGYLEDGRTHYVNIGLR